MTYHHPNYIKSLASRFDNALRFARRDAMRWATNDPKGMFFLGKHGEERKVQEHLAKAEKALQEARDTGHFSEEQLHAWYQRFAEAGRYIEEQFDVR
tara:strand:- start:654 stop:944 length:291 start_codon:yes stop_codon:yes gene_type:complete